MTTESPSWQSRLFRALTFVNSAGLRSVDPTTSQRDLARDVAVRLEQENARLEQDNANLEAEIGRLRRRVVELGETVRVLSETRPS